MKYKGVHANESVDPPSRTGPKKNLTREDFKLDLTEAVKKGMKKPKKKKKPKKPKAEKLKAEKPKQKRAARKSKYAGASYGNMSVAELRSFLNQKKKNLLTKAGFPNGALPRSKVAMISLCKALKRKRW
jgi:hypothetical protein